jgi:hypothetical protein
VLHPNAKEAPPTAAYDTDATVQQVAEFYSQKYNYTIAPNEANNFSSTQPQAFYRVGDLHADAEAAQPVLQKLNLTSDASKAVGSYRGAHISPKTNMPRVTIQRPYFDHQQSKFIEKTLIILVTEDQKYF